MTTDPNDHKRKLADLEATMRKQDEEHEAKTRELRDELNDPRVGSGSRPWSARAWTIT